MLMKTMTHKLKQERRDRIFKIVEIILVFLSFWKEKVKPIAQLDSTSNNKCYIPHKKSAMNTYNITRFNYNRKAEIANDGLY